MRYPRILNPKQSKLLWHWRPLVLFVASLVQIPVSAQSNRSAEKYLSDWRASNLLGIANCGIADNSLEFLKSLISGSEGQLNDGILEKQREFVAANAPKGLDLNNCIHIDYYNRTHQYWCISNGKVYRLSRKVGKSRLEKHGRCSEEDQSAISAISCVANYCTDDQEQRVQLMDGWQRNYLCITTVSNSTIRSELFELRCSAPLQLVLDILM